jgi:hypothetical protein
MMRGTATLLLGSSPPQRAFVSEALGAEPRSVSLILLGGLEDALPGGPPGAEGGHYRAILTAQDEYVGVRLVQGIAGR